jgi:hypothetical protein
MRPVVAVKWTESHGNAACSSDDVGLSPPVMRHVAAMR